ncbi:hypothetical protein [Kitasatospora mediocidica]|uniref:hypothetical protein n=1 Tax=Kitasatospora mediocidica TaxID=58352 RepID=UPI00056794E8|nr:hypothetical protein [Kitasatospora mediocidica]
MDGRIFLSSGERHKNRGEFREPFTGTALVTKQGRTVVSHSIRIVCAAMVVAFTVGLGTTAVGGVVVADRPTDQHGVTGSGFDWDGIRLTAPAQS